MSTQIKTRFAPSPTGDLHIGSLRTALYAFAFAKHNQGKFVVRIEDTDQKRLVEGSSQRVLDILKKFGLIYDEGPDIGGECGPYIQTERLDIYKKYAQELLDKGLAYRCFCTEERLAEMRAKQETNKIIPRYDRRCLNLTPEQIQENLTNGVPYVIRLRLPENETIFFNDLIRGQIKFNTNDLDDQVLVKSNGIPTYHLAVVIDDHLMGITHIIRAEEWIPSTPKHIILYRYFDWEVPQIAHLTVLLDPSHSGKMSKRHGSVFAQQFLDEGYLPEALLNFLMLLGWNPGNDQELFTLDEFTKEFSLEKLQKSNPIFDLEKLNWMNGHYIRQKNLDELTHLCIPYLDNYLQTNYQLQVTSYSFEFLKSIVGLEQERLKKLSEIGERTKYFFERPKVDPKMLVWRKSTPEETQERLKFLLEFLATVPEESWTRNTLQDILIEEIGRRGYGNGDTLWPMRVALSGEEKSPSPFEIAEVLGKGETMERIKSSVR